MFGGDLEQASAAREAAKIAPRPPLPALLPPADVAAFTAFPPREGVVLSPTPVRETPAPAVVTRKRYHDSSTNNLMENPP